MRIGGVAVAWLALACLLCLPASAQYQAPSEKLLITASRAYTWTVSDASVVQLEGPVSIELDRATLQAGQAVIWLRRERGAPASRQRTEFVLMGNAVLRQNDVKRSGDHLYVTAEVEGTVRITADERVAADQSATSLFQQATVIRDASRAAPAATQPVTRPAAPLAIPSRQPAAPIPSPVAEPAAPSSPQPAPIAPEQNTSPTDVLTPTVPPKRVKPSSNPKQGAVAAGPPDANLPPGVVKQEGVTRRVIDFKGTFETTTTEDGTVAAVIGGPLTLIEFRPTGETLELRADRGVLFTPLKSLRDLQQGEGAKAVQDVVSAAYLEGDVRVVVTPAGGPVGEQRLEAERVYYELPTDRAVLTDAVVHMLDPVRQIPIIIRASTIRQISQGEYNAQGVRLSTSGFALPSYAIAADKIYVRRVDTGDPDIGGRTLFNSTNTTFSLFGTPVFYFPVLGGSMTDRGTALRNLGFGNNTALGVKAETEWGLFETLGQPRPKDLDVSYELNYYSDRGPAFGLNADYQGGFLTSVDRDRWAFKGDFHSFLVYDEGFDQFGRAATRLSDEGEFRGRAIWQHQHFLPDDYQVQLRAGYVSDPTFLEQWFPRDFNERLPHDVSAYIKKQHDNEAFTLFANVQPRDFVTTSDMLQEQFEVEHLPEVGYRRLGESFADDHLTFNSENTLAGMRFHTSDASLADQGFVGNLTPGLPSVGYTGTTDGVVGRADFREEISYPMQLGRFKFVPYVMGRYTAYSDSPEGETKHRLLAGAGARLGTAFWKVDEAAYSQMFDINRIRHIIEPEVSVFTSASTVDRGELFIYEEDVDGVNDLSAAQFALRQRWQTKRGGPGRWRNVDFLTLNVEANFFSNKPDAATLRPTNFRGLFYDSEPEASVPRDSVNADATWRISDTTIVLADVQYNIDKSELATAGIGLIARRDERLTYYLGNRYIEELGSNITTVAASYVLSPKYTVVASQSFDFGLGQNVASSIQFVRYFDRFLMSIKVYHNSSTDQSGFSFNIYPSDLGYGFDSDVVGSVFQNR